MICEAGGVRRKLGLLHSISAAAIVPRLWMLWKADGQVLPKALRQYKIPSAGRHLQRYLVGGKEGVCR